MNPSLNALVQRSIELADTAYGEYIAKHWDKLEDQQLKTWAVEDVDYAPEDANLARMVSELGAAKRELAAEMEGASSAEDVYRVCVGYMEREQRLLCYETNDLMLARMKYNYLDQLLSAMRPMLKAGGHLSAEQEQRFDALLGVYELGFSAYDCLREEVRALSDNDSSSLVQWCRDDLEAAGETATLNDDDAFAAYTRDRMGVLLRMYDLDIPDDNPSPLWLYFARHATDLAIHEVADAQGVSVDTVHGEYGKDVKARSHEILNGWVQVLNTDSSYASILRLSASAEASMAAAQHVPIDFDDLVARCVEKAGQKIHPRIGPVCSEHLRQRVPLPKSRAVMQTLLPTYYDPAELEQDMQELLGRIKNSWSSCMNKQHLLGRMDHDVSVMVHDAMFAPVSPAILPLVREFTAEFRREFGKAMHKAGYHDTGTLAVMQRIEEKIGLGYESTLVAGDWLMEHTQGGFDNYYLYSNMAAFKDYGIDPTKLTAEKRDTLVAHAEATLEGLAIERGVPAYAAALPFTPLLCERAMSIAKAEQQEARVREGAASGALSYVDRVRAADATPSQAFSGEEREAIKARTGVLAGNALAVAFELSTVEAAQAEAQTEDTPESLEAEAAAAEDLPEMDTEFSAEGLRDALDYLEGYRKQSVRMN